MNIVKLSSHRLHHRIEGILGERQAYYVKFGSRWKFANYLKLLDDDYELISHVKGVRRARIPESELAECVSWQ